MLKIEIPGSGSVALEHLVLDFTGTLSFDGTLVPGVKERLGRLAGALSVHVITSDTFGTARAELADIACRVEVLEGEDHARQKKEYVDRLGRDSVVAVGNGRNDEEMLAAAGIGIAVVGREGCAATALTAADLVVTSINDGLDLLLHPLRLAATLRR